jgi:hypothetical protein
MSFSKKLGDQLGKALQTAFDAGAGAINRMEDAVEDRADAIEKADEPFSGIKIGGLAAAYCAVAYPLYLGACKAPEVIAKATNIKLDNSRL